MVGRRVLVVGDVMVDEYVWGNVKRISPEAPVMVIEVERDSWTPGGAANVVNNIQALGGRPSMIGVIGDDHAGLALKSRLGDVGVEVRGVVLDSTRPTTRKTRIIAHSHQQNQQVVRVDRESRKRLSHSAVQQVVAQINEQVASVDIVLFSDYDKGMAIPAITEILLDAARRNGKLILANAKPGNIKQFRNAHLVTVNESEAQAASGVLINTEKDVVRAAMRLVNARYGGPEALVVTRGPKGMCLFTRAGGEVIVPGHPIEVYDATGAGDTVASVLALSVAAGATLEEAAVLANCAGGAAVRKVGVATVSRDEIKTMMQSGVSAIEA